MPHSDNAAETAKRFTDNMPDHLALTAIADFLHLLAINEGEPDRRVALRDAALTYYRLGAQRLHLMENVYQQLAKHSFGQPFGLEFPYTWPADWELEKEAAQQARDAGVSQPTPETLGTHIGPGKVLSALAEVEQGYVQTGKSIKFAMRRGGGDAPGGMVLAEIAKNVAELGEVRSKLEWLQDEPSSVSAVDYTPTQVLAASLPSLAELYEVEAQLSQLLVESDGWVAARHRAFLLAVQTVSATVATVMRMARERGEPFLAKGRFSHNPGELHSRLGELHDFADSARYCVERYGPGVGLSEQEVSDFSSEFSLQKDVIAQELNWLPETGQQNITIDNTGPTRLLAAVENMQPKTIADIVSVSRSFLSLEARAALSSLTHQVIATMHNSFEDDTGKFGQYLAVRRIASEFNNLLDSNEEVYYRDNRRDFVDALLETSEESIFVPSGFPEELRSKANSSEPLSLQELMDVYAATVRYLAHAESEIRNDVSAPDGKLKWRRQDYQDLVTKAVEALQEQGAEITLPSLETPEFVSEWSRHRAQETAGTEDPRFRQLRSRLVARGKAFYAAHQGAAMSREFSFLADTADTKPSKDRKIPVVRQLALFPAQVAQLVKRATTLPVDEETNISEAGMPPSGSRFHREKYPELSEQGALVLATVAGLDEVAREGLVTLAELGMPRHRLAADLHELRVSIDQLFPGPSDKRAPGVAATLMKMN